MEKNDLITAKIALLRIKQTPRVMDEWWKSKYLIIWIKWHIELGDTTSPTTAHRCPPDVLLSSVPWDDERMVPFLVQLQTSRTAADRAVKRATPWQLVTFYTLSTKSSLQRHMVSPGSTWLTQFHHLRPECRQERQRSAILVMSMNWAEGYPKENHLGETITWLQVCVRIIFLLGEVREVHFFSSILHARTTRLES